MNTQPPYGRVAILRDRRRASVLMEFLLVFPIILLLVSMLLQFGQIWIARQITAYAAYCATRATLCVGTGEQDRAAFEAARSVCAWMCLAGLSTDEAVTLQEVSHDPLNWNSYHNMTDEVANDDTFYRDTSAPRPYEHNIPGWGSVPGSSSRGTWRQKVRVNTKVLQGGGTPGKYYAAVRVKFKFPLLLPLAGKIISWSVAHPDTRASSYDRETGTWTGDYYSIHSGWQAGKETVMNGDGSGLDRSYATYGQDGSGLDRSYATYGQDGKFPYIELTETCVLPRPYLTTKFKPNRYYYDGGGGS